MEHASDTIDLERLVFFFFLLPLPLLPFELSAFKETLSVLSLMSSSPPPPSSSEKVSVLHTISFSSTKALSSSPTIKPSSINKQFSLNSIDADSTFSLRVSKSNASESLERFDSPILFLVTSVPHTATARSAAEHMELSISTVGPSVAHKPLPVLSIPAAAAMIVLTRPLEAQMLPIDETVSPLFVITARQVLLPDNMVAPPALIVGRTVAQVPIVGKTVPRVGRAVIQVLMVGKAVMQVLIEGRAVMQVLIAGRAVTHVLIVGRTVPLVDNEELSMLFSEPTVPLFVAMTKPSVLLAVLTVSIISVFGLCVLICLVSVYDWEKAFPHTLHLKGLSPE